MLEETAVDEVLESRVDLDNAVEGVVFHRGQLLVVTDQRQRAAEPQRGQCLVGARLVRLVEDHDVEVHVGDRRRCRGGARGEVAVGFEQARVVLVVAAKPLHGGMHALGARHAHGAHAGRARQALQCVVDGEVGM